MCRGSHRLLQVRHQDPAGDLRGDVSRLSAQRGRFNHTVHSALRARDLLDRGRCVRIDQSARRARNRGYAGVLGLGAARGCKLPRPATCYGFTARLLVAARESPRGRRLSILRCALAAWVMHGFWGQCSQCRGLRTVPSKMWAAELRNDLSGMAQVLRETTVTMTVMIMATGMAMAMTKKSGASTASGAASSLVILGSGRRLGLSGPSTGPGSASWTPRTTGFELRLFRDRSSRHYAMSWGRMESMRACMPFFVRPARICIRIDAGRDWRCAN